MKKNNEEKFIDELLKIRVNSIASKIKYGVNPVYPKSQVYNEYNQLFNTLNIDQKQVLSNLLQLTRDDAIFDVLELIDDSIDLKLSQKGEDLDALSWIYENEVYYD